MSINKVSLRDQQSVLMMLKDCELPVIDISPEKLNNFFSYCIGSSIVGVIGLEKRGDVGLLRSLAVTESHRRQGIAGELLTFLEANAVGQGIKALYLLTESSSVFFVKFGYAKIDRDLVPASIKQTEEFCALCPDDAECMKKELNHNTG